MDETMSTLRSVTTVTFMIALGATSGLQTSPTGAQPADSKPMEITTDTPAYCQHLVHRVSDLIRLAATPVPGDVSNLATEGQRMCAIGQTRGGIMRLRSALMMMEQRNGSAYR
jgi:hypothetical protein